MAILIGLIVAVISLIVVAAPFFRSRYRGKGLSSQHSPDETMAMRERIYQEIRTLQLDYQLGNMEEADYQSLMRSYRLEAAALIRRQRQGEQQDLSKLLEDEIRTFRESGIEWSDSNVCPECGYVASSTSDVCPACKSPLENGSSPGNQP